MPDEVVDRLGYSCTDRAIMQPAYCCSCMSTNYNSQIGVMHVSSFSDLAEVLCQHYPGNITVIKLLCGTYAPMNVRLMLLITTLNLNILMDRNFDHIAESDIKSWITIDMCGCTQPWLP